MYLALAVLQRGSTYLAFALLDMTDTELQKYTIMRHYNVTYAVI